MPGDRTTTFLERWVTNPRALVAYSLLLGAAAGTSVWIQHAFRGGTLMFVPTLSAVVYYTIAGTAGVQLLRWRQSAEAWALAAVIPQIMQVQTGVLIYKIVCGPHITVAIDSFGFDVMTGVGSEVYVGLIGPALRTRIGINIVAILFTSYLFYRRRRAA